MGKQVIKTHNFINSAKVCSKINDQYDNIDIQQTNIDFVGF